MFGTLGNQNPGSASGTGSASVPGSALTSNVDSGSIDLKCWIRIRIETSADPQYCLRYIVDFRLTSQWLVTEIKRDRPSFCLVLQTPSKSFRHCSLPRVMCGVFREVKSMS
jgi:hypothetical protein